MNRGHAASGLAVDGEAFKAVTKAHMAVAGQVRCRQIAHSGASAVVAKSFDDARGVRGRQCQADELVDLQRDPAAQREIPKRAKASERHQLGAEIRRNIGPAGAVLADELHDGRGERAAFFVPDILHTAHGGASSPFPYRQGR
jgi:hypothetical protein